MKDTRRGFITSTAIGIGTFALGAASCSAKTGPKSVSGNDLLIAMPNEQYFAVPKSDLSQYAISAEAFRAEEERRTVANVEADDIKLRGNRPPPRTAPMGIRG